MLFLMVEKQLCKLNVHKNVHLFLTPLQGSINTQKIH